LALACADSSWKRRLASNSRASISDRGLAELLVEAWNMSSATTMGRPSLT
jgi:hypothetical protein